MCRHKNDEAAREQWNIRAESRYLINLSSTSRQAELVRAMDRFFPLRRSAVAKERLRLGFAQSMQASMTSLAPRMRLELWPITSPHGTRGIGLLVSSCPVEWLSTSQSIITSPTTVAWWHDAVNHRHRRLRPLVHDHSFPVGGLEFGFIDLSAS